MVHMQDRCGKAESYRTNWGLNVGAVRRTTGKREVVVSGPCVVNYVTKKPIFAFLLIRLMSLVVLGRCCLDFYSLSESLLKPKADKQDFSNYHNKKIHISEGMVQHLR